MIKYKKAFINGKIYTVNSQREWAEAVVVSNNIIVFVGSNSGAQEYIDKPLQLEVFDIKTRNMEKEILER